MVLSPITESKSLTEDQKRSAEIEKQGIPTKDNGGKMVKMPLTISGKPKFASRSDGVEAGIVSGGLRPLER